MDGPPRHEAQSRRAFLAALRAADAAEAVPRILRMMADVPGRCTFGAELLMQLHLPLGHLVRLAAPHIRGTEDRQLLASVADALLRLWAARPEAPAEPAANAEHPLAVLVTGCPQALPLVLAGLTRVAWTPGLWDATLPFLVFLASPDWTSPLSADGAEIIEAFVLLPHAAHPRDVARLLIGALRRLRNPAPLAATYSLAARTLRECLARAGGPLELLLRFADATLLCCAREGRGGSALLLELLPAVPPALRGLFDDVAVLLALHEQQLAAPVMAAAASASWLGIAGFLAGLAPAPGAPPRTHALPAALIAELDAAPLRALLLFLTGGPADAAGPLSRTLRLLAAARTLVAGPAFDPAAWAAVVALTDDVDVAARLLRWLLLRRPRLLRRLLPELLRFAALDDQTRQFALGTAAALMAAPAAALALLPHLARHLAAHPAVFPLLQAALPALLPAAQHQLLAAVCLRRIVAADRRQGHLNYAYSAVAEALRRPAGRPPAATALLLDALLHLCRIRYIDPRIVWRTVVEPHVLPAAKGVALLEAPCALLAAQLLQAQRLGSTRPAPRPSPPCRPR